MELLPLAFFLTRSIELFFIYRSRKINADLLLYLGLTYFFARLIYFGDFLDFITILLTGTNFDYSLIPCSIAHSFFNILILLL